MGIGQYYDILTKYCKVSCAYHYILQGSRVGLAWLGLVFQIHPYPFRATQIQPDLFRSTQSTQIHLDPPIFAPHAPRSIQTHPDLFISARIHPDPTRTTKIHPDPPSYTQIQPDPSKSIQIHQDPPRSIQIHPDPTNSLTNAVPN